MIQAAAALSLYKVHAQYERTYCARTCFFCVVWSYAFIGALPATSPKLEDTFQQRPAVQSSSIAQSPCNGRFGMYIFIPQRCGRTTWQRRHVQVHMSAAGDSQRVCKHRNWGAAGTQPKCNSRAELRPAWEPRRSSICIGVYTYIIYRSVHDFFSKSLFKKLIFTFLPYILKEYKIKKK